ncbi:MAG TPA: tripartite tricarboxylate transporter substrate binding protein, partial [Burkholderiales bacterium]|nr:tripartite tricarboxylate transporter substrate binding protein [Burkholderiales bacterium]
MQMLRRQGMALLLAALPCACAFAQNATSYPGKPIHVIVPYPAGGVVDGLMRSIGQPVSESVGQTVIVDNRPGANTII